MFIKGHDTCSLPSDSSEKKTVCLSTEREWKQKHSKMLYWRIQIEDLQEGLITIAILYKFDIQNKVWNDIIWKYLSWTVFFFGRMTKLQE